MTDRQEDFVLGLDLDGCVADFLDRMKQVFAEWSGRQVEDLDPEPQYGFPEWGLDLIQYRRLHRFAVTQRDLFETMRPVAGAPQALRRLSAEGVRIRIATHRLFIPYFHEPAAGQTIRWLERQGIPYSDLCLIADKSAVRADVFVEDTVTNIERLCSAGTDVICFTNPSNSREEVDVPRAASWEEAEAMIRTKYYLWRTSCGLSLPPSPGQAPPNDDAPQHDDTQVLTAW